MLRIQDAATFSCSTGLNPLHSREHGEEKYRSHWKKHKEITSSYSSTVIQFFKRFYLFLDEGEGREKEIERETSMWCKNIDRCLLYAPRPGTKPTHHACALTGNQTNDLPVFRTMPNQLSHTSQGRWRILMLDLIWLKSLVAKGESWDLTRRHWQLKVKELEKQYKN